MSVFIFFVITLLMVCVQVAIPYLTKRTVVFGVTIPEPMLDHDNLKKYKRQYSIIVTFISVIIIGTYLFWTLTTNPLEEEIALIGALIEFLLILISLAWYFYYHGKIKELKEKNQWGKELKQVKVTDLSIRNQDEMLPWYAYLLPIFISIGLIIYTFMNYELLPNEIPTHWGPNGKPDAFTDKTHLSSVTVLLILVVMQVMFLGIHFGTKKSGIKLSATNLQASRNRQLSLRKYSSWFLFFTVIGVTMLMSFLQLTTIHPNISSDYTKMIVPFAFVILVFIGTILLAIKVGRADKKDVTIVNEKIMEIDEDQYWKGGIVYFNRNDPSIFVEKRFGIGWTINFANPIGYVIILLPILLILLLAFVLS